ncbi:MAG: multicopper oxidase domain-containing protein [Candidatus Wallbacteria bacterium]|nr:multicopper oxidase domain-containing protein [Candidatus Wallbacteria bacterium]
MSKRVFSGREMAMSRRGFLGASAAMAAGIALGGSPKFAEAAPNELGTHGVPVLRPTGGVLRHNLVEKIASNWVGGRRICTRTYNGRIPGPVIRLKPGDTWMPTEVNQSPANPDQNMIPEFMNSPHHLNTFNLHTHGLHVSPQTPADAVDLEVHPGMSFEHTIAIPANHPAGTFWYHPHNHGGVAMALAGGCAGALIIEGGPGTVDAVPEIAAAKEQVFMVQELKLDPATGETLAFDPDLWDAVYPTFTVNGQVLPTVYMRPGEVQRWRWIVAGVDRFLNLGVEGHTLHQIANDGINFAAVEAVPSILAAVASRFDFLIQAGVPGTYNIVRLPHDQGMGFEPDPPQPIMKLVVAGNSMTMGLPTTLPRPSLHPHITDAELVDPVTILPRTRTVTMDMADPLPPNPWPLFMMDNKLFDSARIDQTMKLGTAEEWTVVNTSPEEHPFHIHTNAIEVVKVDGVALATPVWGDTFIVHGNSGSITFRTRFEDFTGQLRSHCHISMHSDLGMMQALQIVP